MYILCCVVFIAILALKSGHFPILNVECIVKVILQLNNKQVQCRYQHWLYYMYLILLVK